MRIAFGDRMGIYEVKYKEVRFTSMQRGTNISPHHFRAEKILRLLSIIPVSQQPNHKLQSSFTNSKMGTDSVSSDLFTPQSLSTFP